jgi:signal transduction histidine kinase
MFENTNIRYRFSAQNNLPTLIVPAEVRHSFYLACKEALHNVIRHSGTKNVLVRVTTMDATIEVCIEDDGCGFDPITSPSTGNGLRNMQRRLDALGGKFDLQSRPAGGTSIRMTIFLDAQAKP